MRNTKSKGFTLVELIIVMVLLGILAAVAVPRMSQSIMAGEEAAEQKMLSTIVSALEIQANDEFLRNSVKSYSKPL
jgi:prepilin-type N-terminal cleavage/methylation domain-containing protein